MMGKTPSSKLDATKKVIVRTVKLFDLGLILQGGYFHGRGHLTYGVDVDRIRWFGILQRISIGYLLAAVSEIWLVPKTLVHSAITFIKKYYIQWMVAILICFTYMGLVYYLYVPSWEFEVSNTSSLLLVPKYGSDSHIALFYLPFALAFVLPARFNDGTFMLHVREINVISKKSNAS